MNYSLHTNFQTSFQIIRKNDQTHFATIQTVFDWLCTKEKEQSLQKGWKEFSFKGAWEHCHRSNTRIQTLTCKEDNNSRAWSMEYSHSDRELGPKRFWHISVGIRDTGETIIVSARVAYSWNTEDLSAEPPTPAPSVPYFIRVLLKNFTAFSGRKEFRLIELPLVLKNSGSGALVRDFVFSPDRRYPLIVFNGDSELQIREARRLATELAGKAQIVVIVSDPALGRELMEAFPRDFHIGYERMRVFFPIGQTRSTSKRHRWYDVSSVDYAFQREGIVQGLLRNHNLIERSSVESIADIHRLITRCRIAKLQQSTEGATEEEIQSLYQDYVKEVESERDIARHESESYAQQIDQLESELQAAEWKNKAFEQAIPIQSTGPDIRTLLFTLPETLSDVVKLASTIYADRLDFAKEAFDSAEENSSCELITDSWHILSHISTTLYDLRFNTESPGEIGKKFHERSGYEYARTEGKLTKGDLKLVRLRKITHNGKDFEIWPHIKKGNDGNKMIRIHFDFDIENEKIVIGFVGLHMDNASSRGRK